MQVPEKSEERGGDGEEGRDGSIEDKPLEEMTKLELLQLIKDGKLNGVGKKRQKVVKGKQPDSAEQNRLPEPNERYGRQSCDPLLVCIQEEITAISYS